VRFRLIENDYAILRSFEGRCSLSTFLNIVVQRFAIDFRIREWGKWHASAEAKRLGEVAVALERLLHREGKTLVEAATILGVSRDSLEPLAARLPTRSPKPREVELDEAAILATSSDPAERAHDRDRERTSHRISDVVARFVGSLPEEERLIVALRFENGMTVAQIARALQLDQKLLYRRIERHMRDLREELVRAGIDSLQALDLIGRDNIALDFHLGNPSPRPSMRGDETVAKSSEASQ
jgi:RNA polymerase sigma factor (sigma-70 family)